MDLESIKIFFCLSGNVVLIGPGSRDLLGSGIVAVIFYGSSGCIDKRGGIGQG